MLSQSTGPVIALSSKVTSVSLAVWWTSVSIPAIIATSPIILWYKRMLMRASSFPLALPRQLTSPGEWFIQVSVTIVLSLMATWCINPLEVLLLLVPLLALTYFHFIYQKEVVDSNLDSKTSKMPG